MKKATWANSIVFSEIKNTGSFEIIERKIWKIHKKKTSKNVDDIVKSKGETTSIQSMLQVLGKNLKTKGTNKVTKAEIEVNGRS